MKNKQKFKEEKEMDEICSFINKCFDNGWNRKCVSIEGLRKIKEIIKTHKKEFNEKI